jgi:hypothetical protein
MAVLTAGQISRLAIALLRRQLVLPATVSMVPSQEFRGSNGDTVTVRVPQPSTARTQATPSATITYDDVTEIGVDVSVAHLYHAKLVSDEELTMSLVDFGQQVLAPQVAAVATAAESQVASAMNAVAADGTITVSGGNIGAIFLEAREALGRAEVPLSQRYVAVSPEVASFVLATDEMTDADKSGSPTALREAIIGRYRGFTVVESSGLTAGHALFYHRSAVAWANFAPVRPSGAVQSATVQDQGVALRHIRQYVPDKLSDASVVSTFAGASMVTDSESGAQTPRFYKATTATS